MGDSRVDQHSIFDEIPEYIAELEEKVKHYGGKIEDIKGKPNQTEEDVKRREGYEKVLKEVLKQLKQAKEDFANLPE